MTLQEYCDQKEITLTEFAKMTGISFSYIFKIRKDRNANLTLDIIEKIYQATLNRFGEGLPYYEYLDINKQ